MFGSDGNDMVISVNFLMEISMMSLKIWKGQLNTWA